MALPSSDYRDSGLPDMIIDRKYNVATMSTMVKKAIKNGAIANLLPREIYWKMRYML
jgi:hypothetical protein